MPYQVELSTGAARQFRKLPKDIQIRLKPHIDALANNPRPRNSIKLKGEETGYRLRVGDYRVLYEIQDKRLLVLVVKFTQREKAYHRR